MPASKFWRDERKEAGTTGYPHLHPTGVCFTAHRALTHCRYAPPVSDVSRHRSPVFTCQLPHICCSLAPPPVISTCVSIFVLIMIHFSVFWSSAFFPSVFSSHSVSLCLLSDLSFLTLFLSAPSFSPSSLNFLSFFVFCCLTLAHTAAVMMESEQFFRSRGVFEALSVALCIIAPRREAECYRLTFLSLNTSECFM